MGFLPRSIARRLHVEILSAEQIAVLDELSAVGELSSFYLAGGTALALRHAHRRSVDFDFFRRGEFDERSLLAAIETRFPSLGRVPSGERTLYVVLDGVTTSFFTLPYRLVKRGQRTRWGFDLASDEDLAAMKLEAILGRGSRKDFVDLRILCRRFSLDRVFELFDRKYGSARTERYHRLRALTYFEDAEREPMPDMLVEFDWSEAKRFFTAEATRLLRSAAE